MKKSATHLKGSKKNEIPPAAQKKGHGSLKMENADRKGPAEMGSGPRRRDS